MTRQGPTQGVGLRGVAARWTIIQPATTMNVMDERHSSSNSTPAARRFDSLAQEAFLVLWRTYDRLRILEDELFRRVDITAQQYNVLRLLRGVHPGRIPTLTLASRLVSRAPDITRMLDKLAERKFIERERLADNRRVVEIGITPAGLALLKSLDAEVRACHQAQLGHMSDADLKQLVELLNHARQPHEDAQSVWR